MADEIDYERLKKLQAKSKQGSKGAPRKKVPSKKSSTGSTDQKVASALKKLQASLQVPLACLRQHTDAFRLSPFSGSVASRHRRGQHVQGRWQGAPLLGTKRFLSFALVQLGSLLRTLFSSSSVHAAVPSNTFAVYGQGQDKELTELVPGILNQLGPESLANLRKLAESYQSSAFVLLLDQYNHDQADR